MTALAVAGLTVETDEGHRLVEDLSFDLASGEIMGLVGESGSGKTMACRALLGLLPSRRLRTVAGSVTIDGRDVLALPPDAMRRVRGREIGMIFQNPSSHLDPVMRIGDQIAESLRLHEGLSRREARREAVECLRRVGIPDPERRVAAWPHEFSGGMRQRAMIAVALACGPAVLVADEPTTALDVTVQAQILTLLRRLRDERGLAIVLITHDLGVVAQTCDSVAVLYAGRLCERGPIREVLRRPAHRYTEGLIRCQPASGSGTGRLDTVPGQPPPADAMPAGCRFHPRCAHASEACRRDAPPPEAFGPAHVAACRHPATAGRAA